MDPASRFGPLRYDERLIVGAEITNPDREMTRWALLIGAPLSGPVLARENSAHTEFVERSILRRTDVTRNLRGRRCGVVAVHTEPAIFFTCISEQQDPERRALPTGVVRRIFGDRPRRA